MKYAKKLPALDASNKVSTNRVMGCTSEVWMTASLDSSNRVQFAGDSDSELTRGLCAVLVQSMSGLKPEEVLQVCSSTPLTAHKQWPTVSQVGVGQDSVQKTIRQSCIQHTHIMHNSKAYATV